MNLFIQVEQARKNSRPRYWLMERYRPDGEQFDSIRKIAEVLELEYAKALQNLIDKVETYTRQSSSSAPESDKKRTTAAPVVPPGAPDNPSGILIRSGAVKGK